MFAEDSYDKDMRFNVQKGETLLMFKETLPSNSECEMGQVNAEVWT
jgi:hypothetical protein